MGFVRSLVFFSVGLTYFCDLSGYLCLAFQVVVKFIKYGKLLLIHYKLILIELPSKEPNEAQNNSEDWQNEHRAVQ